MPAGPVEFESAAFRAGLARINDVQAVPHSGPSVFGPALFGPAPRGSTALFPSQQTVDFPLQTHAIIEDARNQQQDNANHHHHAAHP